MKYVAQYAEGFGREQYLVQAKRQIPELEIVEDIEKRFIEELNIKSAMLTFLKSIDFTEPFIRIEDDTILCHNFKERAAEAVAVDLNCIHQFFSMRNSDKEYGSGYRLGSGFIATVGFYVPAGMGHEIVRYYYDTWRDSKRGIENPTGFDLLIADYMKANKLKYYVHIPCLVEHAVEKSAINPKRSSKRQSCLFIDDVI